MFVLIDWHMMQTVLSVPLQRVCDKCSQFPGEPTLPIVDLGRAVDCRLHHASDHRMAKTLAGGGSDFGSALLQPGHQERWLFGRSDLPGNVHPPRAVRECAVLGGIVGKLGTIYLT